MTPIELLTRGSSDLGISLTDKQIRLLFLYITELSKWNRRINLTSITSDRDVVIKHLLDSLSYIQAFSPGPGRRLLDMGSGAGLPAIPIKIACPDLSITLIESVKKKASFLRHVIRTLPLEEVEVLDQRIDEVAVHYDFMYDVVTARAFAGMGAALQSGCRFLKPGALMVLSRGPEETVDPAEIASAGVDIERTLKLRLPYSDYERAIWVFRKKS